MLPGLARRLTAQRLEACGSDVLVVLENYCEWVRAGGEIEIWPEDVTDRRIEVEVHDVSDGIASATVRCALYVDLLQLLKTREGWRIVNVAWRDR